MRIPVEDLLERCRRCHDKPSSSDSESDDKPETSEGVEKRLEQKQEGQDAIENMTFIKQERDTTRVIKRDIAMPKNIAGGQPIDASLLDDVLVARLRKDPKYVSNDVFPVDVAETSDEIFVLADLVGHSKYHSNSDKLQRWPGVSFSDINIEPGKGNIPTLKLRCLRVPMENLLERCRLGNHGSSSDSEAKSSEDMKEMREGAEKELESKTSQSKPNLPLHVTLETEAVCRKPHYITKERDCKSEIECSDT